VGRLTEAGIPARAYHAGLGAAEREAVQDWFMTGTDAPPPSAAAAPLQLNAGGDGGGGDGGGGGGDEGGGGCEWPDDARVVVGTIAFGMGLDKADVRYVYHLR
jgi:hypothetical protein